MEHENVDENAEYLKACENVKKIVNAIKAIRIKYYTNFSKISAEDKQRYDLLEENLEKISKKNESVDRLKVALMGEVSAKYASSEQDKKQENEPNTVDEKIKACYGAVDVMTEALRVGKLKKALACQKIFQQHFKEIDSKNDREVVINYKRGKIDELVISREQVQNTNEVWMKVIKSFCKPEFTVERGKVIKQIELKTKPVPLFDRAVNQNFAVEETK